MKKRKPKKPKLRIPTAKGTKVHKDQKKESKKKICRIHIGDALRYMAAGIERLDEDYFDDHWGYDTEGDW